MFDEYYVAFTEPSAEHVRLYVRAFVVFGVVGYALWYFLVESRREVVNMKVNFDDIGG